MPYPPNYPLFTPSYGRHEMSGEAVVASLYIPAMPKIVCKVEKPEGGYAYWIECRECPVNCDCWAPYNPDAPIGVMYEYACVDHGHSFKYFKIAWQA